MTFFSFSSYCLVPHEKRVRQSLVTIVVYFEKRKEKNIFAKLFFCLFDLFGQLLLTQLVQREEFARQLHIVDEATTGQLHPDDDLAVRHHHGYAAEVDLQVLWQLLATCVTWILDDRERMELFTQAA